jgi:hypothetical protein
MITAAIAASLVAFVLPASASAHHFHHHRRHHRRAHTVVFSPAATPAPNSTEGGTTENTPGEEDAGTIASYEGGVLTIALADGSTVSGKVTEHTSVQCGCQGHYGWQNGDGRQGDGNDNWQGDGGGGYFGHDRGDDFQGPSQESCGVSSLVAGAKVKQAELSVSGAGAVWQFVDLVPSGEQQQHP